MTPETASMTDKPAASSHALQCMEIIGGNQATQHALSTPGLDIWVDSRPFRAQAGGDIHYFSVCGSGRVTRLALADVSGHGAASDQVARSLRKLMRKHINLLDQTRFAQAINREFTEQSASEYFATVLLATYFAPTDHLIVCNAGHPRPIWFSQRSQQWQLLDPETPDLGPSIRDETVTYCLKPVANLPLGIIEPTDYCQFAVKLAEGDLVLLYTDAFTEARGPDERMLGETGLLDMARRLRLAEPRQLSESLIAMLDDYRAHAPPDDDQTLIVLRHNASNPPPMTVGQALKSLAKMLGLGRV